MTTIEDPVRAVVPSALALKLAEVCALNMQHHSWDAANVEAARQALSDGYGRIVLRTMRQRLARRMADGPGWMVLALSARLSDEQLRRAAAGLLAALGRPFNSIDQDGELWIGRESAPGADAASFGGFGAQALHVDAPNVDRVPDYTSLLVLRPDPAGGGASLVGDLRAALAMLDDHDRAELARPMFYEGRAVGLRGVGAARLPFPVVEDVPDGRWIRWAAKMVHDPRNAGSAGPLTRFAEALESVTSVVALGRGQLLILDQQRTAHGRTALGDQRGLPEGAHRWLVQAKAAYDATAPAQCAEVDDE